jgi:hypothetical protein
MTPTSYVVVVWRDTSTTGGYYAPRDVVRTYQHQSAAQRYADSPDGRLRGLVVRSAAYVRGVTS